MSHIPDFPDFFTCEADGCDRRFKTLRGMHSHLSTARSCAWYLKGKLKEMVDDVEELVDDGAFQIEEEPERLEEWEDFDPRQDPDIDFDFNFGPYEEEFHYIPNEAEAGPGPQTAANRILRGASSVKLKNPLFQDLDERVTETDEEAGRIRRQEEPPRYIPIDKDGDTVMDAGDEPNPFAPFSSELDWRVAQWAVKDGPGDNAFNRLLEIPGVSKFSIFFLVVLF